MSKSVKKNDTAIRVLEILKLLMNNSLTAQELVNFIEKHQNIENIYSKETLHKYFNTLDLLGLKIVKQKKTNKFCLKKLPVEIDLDEQNLKVLCLLEAYVKQLYLRKLESDFDVFKDYLVRSFNNKTIGRYSLIKENTNFKDCIDFFCNMTLVRRFEKLCTDGLKIQAAYVNRTKRATEILILEPRSLTYSHRKTYLSAYNPKTGKNHKLLLDNIINVIQLPQKVSERKFLNSIVFELNETLAKSYKLKDGETVIDSSSNQLIVSNSFEDKNLLYKRLLRYGKYAKVLRPKESVAEFKELVENVIKNLENED